MKRIFMALALIAAIAWSLPADASGGHYKGGHGSSHKGGKYVNPKTGNHYTKHK